MTIILPFFKYRLKEDRVLANSINNLFNFYPGNINLYKIALHHKSAPICLNGNISINNERMEYLGDAVLSTIIAEYLFKLYPLKDEGFLSEMRSKIVSRKQLNKVSRDIGLTDLIEFNSSSPINSIAGDALEAVIGAIFLDRGFRFTRKTILKHVVLKYFDIKELEQQKKNFKSRLIEWSQKNKRNIEFKVLEEIPGNGCPKQYIVSSYLDGKPMCKGCDYNIKGAEQFAAEKTLELLEIEDTE